jgi:hypothetical protein
MPSGENVFVSAVGDTSATLNGEVNPQGRRTEYQFLIGSTLWEPLGPYEGYYTFLPENAVNIGSGTTFVPLSEPVAGLSPSTTYKWGVEVYSTNMSTNSVGGGEFTTAAAPTATTGEASEITASEAKVSGTVNPTSSVTSYRVEWGTTTAYGHSSSGDAGSGSSSVAVSTKLTGLRPDTTYHYRVSAEKAASISVAGSSHSFTTSAASPESRSLPALSGNATVGESLHSDIGLWSTTVSNPEYQWERCNATGGSCTDVEGATSSSYTLSAADVGATMRVHVTVLGAGETASATSSESSVVQPPSTLLRPLVPPSISGVAYEGQTLVADPGEWSAEGAPTYAYQWQRCNSSGASCTNVSGATE